MNAGRGAIAFLACCAAAIAVVAGLQAFSDTAARHTTPDPLPTRTDTRSTP